MFKTHEILSTAVVMFVAFGLLTIGNLIINTPESQLNDKSTSIKHAIFEPISQNNNVNSFAQIQFNDDIVKFVANPEKQTYTADYQTKTNGNVTEYIFVSPADNKTYVARVAINNTDKTVQQIEILNDEKVIQILNWENRSWSLI